VTKNNLQISQPPDVEFDMEASTAAFDKMKFFEEVERMNQGEIPVETKSLPKDEPVDGAHEHAYEKAEFFDTISCESRQEPKDKEGRRQDRAKTKKVDAETFGVVGNQGSVRKPPSRYNPREAPPRTQMSPSPVATPQAHAPRGRRGGRGGKAKLSYREVNKTETPANQGS